MTTAQNHEWDVFVSHNGKQKPWARELVRQLRDLNLQVFFDEDDISTGEDITLKLEYALDHCRCVALVLSKSALDSSWVAMERATAIIDDPSSQTPRLLPIMIEPIDRDEIPRTLRRLKYADLTNSDSQQRVANYHRFLKDLGVNAQQLPEPPEWNFVVTPNHSGDESLSGDPLNVPGRLATESSSGSVAIDVREGFIELTIDEDFASFDENRQRQLTDKIRSALSVGNVKIIQAKKGSVVLVLRFEDSTDADTVVSAANSGALQSLNVVSASRIAAPVDFARPAPVSIPAPAAPSGADARNSKPAALDAETEAEIEAAMADLTEAGAAEGSNKKIRGPREVRGGREHRTGTVVSVGASDVFVEFGPKELGVVEATHFKGELPKVADQLEVVVQRYDANESLFVCVLPGSIQKADWEMLQVGQTVEARVSGVNKGGLELEIANHRAFMPASQVDVNRIPDLSIFVGEKLTCTVQKIDRRGSGNIVLSRRDILQAERAKAAESLKEALKEGDTIEGVVRKVMDFGAFVDLGGVDGLIHLNDLSHERVNHGEKNVAKFVTEGKKVSVQILKLDWDANRISLGLKQLQADPFKAAASEIVEGAQLTGKVTKCLDFGAFVEVAPGVEGLVHISELDWRRVASVDEVVKQDEVVQVKVLKIDPDTRKISLSIKQTKEAPQRQGGGGRGRGKRGDRDDRTAEEILKETPALRRMREQAKQRDKAKSNKDTGGLGQAGGLGIGLGDLKL